MQIQSGRTVPLRRICQDRMGQKHFATVPLKIRSLHKSCNIFLNYYHSWKSTDWSWTTIYYNIFPVVYLQYYIVSPLKKNFMQITFHFGVYLANDVMLVFHICRKCFYIPSAKNTDALNVCPVSFFGSVNNIRIYYQNSPRITIILQ